MMEAFKVEYFERDHPGEQYPTVAPLPSSEAASFAERLATLVARVYPSEPLPGVDANSETFQLNRAWGIGLRPADELLLSFDGLKSIDKMRRVDVERNFTDVWYPLSDNLFIFDGSASWLLFVHHEGDIYVAWD